MSDVRAYSVQMVNRCGAKNAQKHGRRQSVEDTVDMATGVLHVYYMGYVLPF